MYVHICLSVCLSFTSVFKLAGYYPILQGGSTNEHSTHSVKDLLFHIWQGLCQTRYSGEMGPICLPVTTLWENSPFLGISTSEVPQNTLGMTLVVVLFEKFLLSFSHVSHSLGLLDILMFCHSVGCKLCFSLLLSFILIAVWIFNEQNFFLFFF